MRLLTTIGWFLVPLGLAAQESPQALVETPARESVAYVFGYSGSFTAVSFEESTILARWRLSETADLDRLLPETTRGGLGQWLIYDPVYDALRHRLLFVAPTDISAFEDLGHQLIAVYPPSFGVVGRADLGRPVGQPPMPPRLLQDPAGGLVLLRPASGAGYGVEVSRLSEDTLRPEKTLSIETAGTRNISGVAAVVGEELLLGGELFTLSAADQGTSGPGASSAEPSAAGLGGTPIRLLDRLDADARQSLRESLGAPNELPSEFLDPYLVVAASPWVVARIPKIVNRDGQMVPLGSSLLVAHDLARGTAQVIELAHLGESLALSGAGAIAVTIDPAKGQLTVFDLATGSHREQVSDTRFADPQARVLCVSRDGHALVAASEQLLVWSPGGEVISVLRGARPADWLSCALAPY